MFNSRKSLTQKLNPGNERGAKACRQKGTQKEGPIDTVEGLLLVQRQNGHKKIQLIRIGGNVTK